MKVYHLYILKCSDNSLYTGITNDLENRLSKHEKGKGSKYVRSRLPFKLIHTEKFRTKSKALKREAEIKQWPREKKLHELGL
jgi:putative endonuclease